MPKYFGFYKGRDGYHTPYNGKFAHIYLGAGKGAFRDRDFDSEPSYAAGIQGLLPKPIEWDKRAKELIYLSYNDDKAIVQEFVHPETDIEGISVYGYGFWCKYLTAAP